MLLFSAFLAAAAPLPLPPHVQAGPVEGFVAVWVDPKRLGNTLEPTEPGPSPGPEAGSVDLPIENIASARAVVSISGVEIGEVAPYARAVIHGVAPGTYSLEFRMPNGYVRKAQAITAPGLSYAAPYRMR